MEDMVSKFFEQFVIMKDEQQILVVDAKEASTLSSSKVFLVGKVLIHKPFNKETFKRQMGNLWKPKVNVFIMDLENDIFAFGFNTKQERTPMRRCMTVQIDGSMVTVNVRYEKLPLTCFLCGMMDSIEDQCEKFCGKNDDDKAKHGSKMMLYPLNIGNHRRNALEEDEVAAHIPEMVGQRLDDWTTDENSMNESSWGLQRDDETHNRQIRPFILDLNDLALFLDATNNSTAITVPILCQSQRNNDEKRMSTVIQQSLDPHNIIMIFGMQIQKEHLHLPIEDVVMLDQYQVQLGLEIMIVTRGWRKVLNQMQSEMELEKVTVVHEEWMTHEQIRNGQGGGTAYTARMRQRRAQRKLPELGKRSEREMGDNWNRHEPKRRFVVYSFMNSTTAEADEY
ncbi:hypothetical protein FF2_002264 [Malus domestica]